MAYFVAIRIYIYLFFPSPLSSLEIQSLKVGMHKVEELTRLSSGICKNAYVKSSGAFWSSSVTDFYACRASFKNS